LGLGSLLLGGGISQARKQAKRHRYQCKTAASAQDLWSPIGYRHFPAEVQLSPGQSSDPSAIETGKSAMARPLGNSP
jgi:hypothetical protein